MFIAFLGLLATVTVTERFRRRAPDSVPWRVVMLWLPAVWVFFAGLGLIWSFVSQTGLVLWSDSALMVGASVSALAVFVLLFPVSWRGRISGLLIVVLGVLLFSDQPYLRYFGTVVPLAALGATGQLPHLGESIGALLEPGDTVFLFWSVVGVVFALRWPRDGVGLSRERRRIYAVMLGFPLSLWAVMTPATFLVGFGASDPNRVVVQKNLLGRWGVLNVHAFGVYEQLRDRLIRQSLTETDLEQMSAVVADREAEHPGTDDSWFGRAQGANVIIVHLESVQDFVVGARYAEQAITPFLDRWVDGEALRFDRIFDQTHQGRTSDAQFMVFNGLHPFSEGSVVFQREHNQFVALPGILRALGYETAAAFPYERGFWNTARMFQAWGFSGARYAEDFAPGEEIGWGLADHEFLSQMTTSILESEEPFLHYLVPLSLHFPYADFPSVHKRLRLGDLEGTPLGNYLHAVHHLDAALGVFFGELEAQGLLSRSLVVLYGDHDWGFPVDERVRQLAESDYPPSLLLDRVPLIIRMPDKSAFGTVQTIGGHVDIAPTVLHLLGEPRPAGMVGTSLLPARPRTAVLPNGSGVSETRAWIAAGETWQPEGRGRGKRVDDAGCWDGSGAERLPDTACEEVQQRAREELRVARDIVWFDQAARLTSTRGD